MSIGRLFQARPGISHFAHLGSKPTRTIRDLMVRNEHPLFIDDPKYLYLPPQKSILDV